MADAKKNEGSSHLERVQRESIDELFSLIYEELRRLASRVRRKDVHATINSTALVHEAWMKLRDSPSLASKSLDHFLAIAACAMRQVLVDEARRRCAQKRGAGEISFVIFDETHESAAEPLVVYDEELLTLDASLIELASCSPRQVQMVECRFFLGLSVAETAKALGVSASAVERDWRAAKAWLATRIRPQHDLPAKNQALQ